MARFKNTRAELATKRPKRKAIAPNTNRFATLNYKSLMSNSRCSSCQESFATKYSSTWQEASVPMYSTCGVCSFQLSTYERTRLPPAVT